MNTASPELWNRLQRVFADFFVEVGASNLFPLHEQLFQRSDWGGLAVEPLDFARRQLPSRPGLRAEGAALGCPRGAATTPFYAVDAAHLHSGAVPAYALGAASIEPGGPFAAWASETRVPCAAWADVAARHGLAPCGDQAITLVKVDAEGRDAATSAWEDAARNRASSASARCCNESALSRAARRAASKSTSFVRRCSSNSRIFASRSPTRRASRASRSASSSARFSAWALASRAADSSASFRVRAAKSKWA